GRRGSVRKDHQGLRRVGREAGLTGLGARRRVAVLARREVLQGELRDVQSPLAGLDRVARPEEEREGRPRDHPGAPEGRQGHLGGLPGGGPLPELLAARRHRPARRHLVLRRAEAHRGAGAERDPTARSGVSRSERLVQLPVAARIAGPAEHRRGERPVAQGHFDREEGGGGERLVQARRAAPELLHRRRSLPGAARRDHREGAESMRRMWIALLLAACGSASQKTAPAPTTPPPGQSQASSGSVVYNDRKGGFGQDEVMPLEAEQKPAPEAAPAPVDPNRPPTQDLPPERRDALVRDSLRKGIQALRAHDADGTVPAAPAPLHLADPTLAPIISPPH